jgi:DNA-binding GntR family transcriptional regulator
MREADLAARFSISKSPVRDALMQLEREGLVITSPRQGYRVAPVSMPDVQDMFDLRAALESACMERIARGASEEALRSLDRFRVYQANDWPHGFVDYNRAFHNCLAELAGNARMRKQLSDLIDEMERAVLLSMSSIKKSGNPQSVINEHGRIIDALQARQPKVAQRLAEKHIAAGATRVRHALSQMLILG